MLFLADFSVMNPSFGLLFWTTIIFLFVWLVIGRSFKSIKEALKKRDSSIEEALMSAEKAREEIKLIQSSHDAELKKAREERLRIIKEAEEIKEKILEEARTRADESTRKLLESAKVEIENRRKEMEINFYNEIGKMSVAIAQQLLHRELEGKHDAFVADRVEEFKQKKFGSRV
jgi:F-type H+-transporting ATPase subunit b